MKLSLMNASFNSLEKTIKQIKTFFEILSCLYFLAHLFLKKMQLTSKLMEQSVLIQLLRIFLKKNCMLIRLLMPSTTEMYCDSILTTSSRKMTEMLQESMRNNKKRLWYKLFCKNMTL